MYLAGSALLTHPHTSSERLSSSVLKGLLCSMHDNLNVWVCSLNCVDNILNRLNTPLCGIPCGSVCREHRVLHGVKHTPYGVHNLSDVLSVHLNVLQPKACLRNTCLGLLSCFKLFWCLVLSYPRLLPLGGCLWSWCVLCLDGCLCINSILNHLERTLFNVLEPRVLVQLKALVYSLI